MTTLKLAQPTEITRRSFCLGFALGAAAFGLGCAGSRCSARENAAVRAAIRKYIADGLYAGLACASNRGDLYLEGSIRLGEPKLPVTAESLFDLASVGKTQTAALCALLYADGKLDVDAPFTEYMKKRHGVSQNQTYYNNNTDNKQESFVSTGLRNECCTGYWMAGCRKTIHH